MTGSIFAIIDRKNSNKVIKFDCALNWGDDKAIAEVKERFEKENAGCEAVLMMHFACDSEIEMREVMFRNFIALMPQ